MLEKEIETYYKNKEELLNQDRGKYVLIKNGNVIGTFDSEKDAIKIGIDKFGNIPFLVKKIETIEEEQNFTSDLINLC